MLTRISRRNGWAAVPIKRGPIFRQAKLFSDDYFNRPGIWDDPKLDSLVAANKQWVQRTFNTQFAKDMKNPHNPKILWIGCSDARVPANEIIGEPPGSVFIHRNIANQVVNTDMNCLSVIQYAVNYLKVKHIMVVGHYDCGGVKAALTNKDHEAPLENWLRQIRDTYRLHREELQALEPLQRQRRLVELNVMEQCLNLFKSSLVQKRRVETAALAKTDPRQKFAEPRVHGFVYDPTTGVLQRVKFDFPAYLSDLHEVYSLYDDNFSFSLLASDDDSTSDETK